jgi:hypothetical protein
MDDREKVELFISCRGLKDMDTFSKSDPQVTVYFKKGRSQTFIMKGKTEKIDDNLNPNFATSFIFDYIFEIQQAMRFEVVDIDGPGQFDYIGHAETKLGTIVGAKNSTLILPLVDRNNNKKQNGKIILRTEKVQECNEMLTLNYCAKNLKCVMGWFSTSNPYLKFFRSREDGNWIKVHETPVIDSNLSPDWPSFQIKMQKLCNGDPYRPIKVECWAFIKNSDHKIMGECTFTVDEIKTANKRQWELY